MNTLLFFSLSFLFLKGFLDRNKLKDKTPTESTLLTFKAEHSYRETSVFQSGYAVDGNKFGNERTKCQTQQQWPWKTIGVL